MGRWRGSKPADGIIIQVVLVMVGSDMEDFTGGAGNVINQGADHRTAIMANRCMCCAGRKDCKVQWTIDREKAIIIGIEWKSTKYWW